MPQQSEIITTGGRLYHLGVRPEEVARSVFLVGDPARAQKVAARFETVEHEVRHREYVTLTGRCRGVAMTVVGTGIGTDNVEIALVELHAAHAIDLATGEARAGAAPLDLIRVGTSGGVQPDVAAGTLCIAEYAVGFDSTGPFYEAPAADAVVELLERGVQLLIDEAVSPESRFAGFLRAYAARASPEVHAALVRHAEDGGVPWASGVTVSAPGFFGASSRYVHGLDNTVPDIKGRLSDLRVGRRRVLNMEMESSLLFHLAGALGYRAGTICPAISQPGSHGAVVDYDAAIEAAIDAAVGAMLELAGAAG